MKAEVQTLNEKGRPVAAKERKLLPTFRGVLSVHEARSGQLGRITPMAQLVSSTDSAETHLLPALHDAAVLYLKDGQMRIRGFEMVAMAPSSGRPGTSRSPDAQGISPPRQTGA